MDNLSEINFSVQVTNTAPFVFTKPLQTVFQVNFNQTLDYYFPAISLAKGQQKPEINIEKFDDFEDYFPSKFLTTFDAMDRI